MTFSLSTFVIDINSIPTLVFQAKWQAEADRICREWILSHWDELSTKGPRGVDLPPAFKLRLARAPERAAFEAAADHADWYGEVKIVKLANAPGPQDEPDAIVSTDEVSNGAAEKQQDATESDG